MPEALRPDRCHAVLTAVPGESTLVVHLDPNYPLAWKEGLLGRLLRTFMENGGRAILALKDSRRFLALREVRR